MNSLVYCVECKQSKSTNFNNRNVTPFISNDKPSRAKLYAYEW